jgi:hypothetical protein
MDGTPLFFETNHSKTVSEFKRRLTDKAKKRKETYCLQCMVENWTSKLELLRFWPGFLRTFQDWTKETKWGKKNRIHSPVLVVRLSSSGGLETVSEGMFDTSCGRVFLPRLCGCRTKWPGRDKSRTANLEPELVSSGRPDSTSAGVDPGRKTH